MSYFSSKNQQVTLWSLIVGLGLSGVAIFVVIIEVIHHWHRRHFGRRVTNNSHAIDAKEERNYLECLRRYLNTFPERKGGNHADALIVPADAHPRKIHPPTNPPTQPPTLYKYNPIDYLENRELRRAELYTRTRFGRKTRIKDLAKELRRHTRIVVLGDPGAGKSVCLRKLAYDICDTELAKKGRPETIPIYVEMTTYDGWESESARAPMKPLTFLRNSLQRQVGENETDNAALMHVANDLPQLLREGRATLIFDALDEMPQDSYLERYKVLKAFTGDNSSASPHWDTRGRNQFVFSCRLLDYDEAFVVSEVIIDPFDTKKIDLYLDQHAAPLAKVLKQRIEDDETLRELVSNPFFLHALTYISLLHGEAEQQLQLPTSRGELIAKFAKAMLDTEAGKKQKESLARIQGGLATLESFLSEIGFALQERRAGRTSAPVDSLQDVWDRYPQWKEMLLIGQRANILGERGVIRDHLPFVKARAEIIANSGLRAGAHSSKQKAEIMAELNMHSELFVGVKTADDIEPPERIEFKHHRLQEYFAARELAKRFAAGEAVERYLEDIWWQETVIFAVGIVDDPRSIIERMLATQPDTNEWIRDVLVEAKQSDGKLIATG